MSANFYVVALTPSGEQPVEGDGPWVDGKDAARVAKELQATIGLANGFKYQPRRMAAVDPEAWKAREVKRFADGTYRTLPEDWINLKPIQGHYLHISTKTSGRIQYFDSAENGILDRAVETTPGRYLKQFYPSMDEESIKTLVAKIDNMSEVLFARTAKDIVWVYNNGPESCMSRAAGNYNNLKIHPAECYASDDLAVAYLMNKDGKRASARVVCCPRLSVYGTVYGDKARLSDQLNKLGYTKVDTFPPGVKFAKRKRSDDAYIMSYGDNYGYSVDRGDYLETVSGRGGSFDMNKFLGQVLVSPGNSSGQAAVYRVCPKTKSLQSLSGWAMVHGPNEEWSHQAINSYTFMCPGSKKRWANEPKYTRLVFTSESHFSAGRKTTWSVEHAEENAFQCSVTGHLYANNLLARVEGDRKISTHAVQLEDAKRLHDERIRLRRIEKEKEDALYRKKESLMAAASDPKPRRKAASDQIMESTPTNRNFIININGSLSTPRPSASRNSYQVRHASNADISNEEVYEGA